MRITSNMIAAQQMTALQTNASLMQQAQARLSSGKRLNAASDDPAAAMSVMGTGSALRALEQYRTNVKRASDRIDLEDGVLSQLGDLISRVKELAVSQAGDSATDQTRGIANAEVQQIFHQIIQLGNTKFGNEFLFGGDQSMTAPFSDSGSGASLDYTSTNPQGQRSIGIGEGQTIAPTHDGTQVFLDTGVLDAVKDVVHSLDSTSGTYGKAGIAAAMTKLDNAFDAVQGVVGDTGALGNRLTSVGQNLDALSNNLTSFKSDLEDVDVETAMTELTNRQVAYQAALLATSKVTSLNLSDYLK
jgi:flagellar hook-associated protein 3 FlgL